jgi:hypothetical protein
MKEIPHVTPDFNPRQTRLGSFIEVCINIGIGFSINFVMNLTLFPLFGWDISVGENLLLGCIYTVVSVIRGYIVRRWFEGKIHEAAMRLAKHG